ncbi:MAG: hypothetical protein JWO09_2548 [Bacteroidetes bacterium]|nr:hypothetical protein [Bacteroidota bacterium]
MQLIFTSLPETLFFIVFIAAIGILVYISVSMIVKDMREEKKKKVKSSVTARQVSHYFTGKGYVVCNITPVKNSNKWLAFLVKNGEYLIATVFTNGERIEGHLDSLE